jgi:acyl dehydratase
VRFIAPAMVGSRIRARFDRAAAEERDDGTKVVWHVTVESDGSEKPCCVADWIVLYVR